MGANRALIANPVLAGQRMRGVYFFAGNWNFAPPGGVVQKFYEAVPGPNDGFYTVHPTDARHLGWSESASNRAFALQTMLHAGVNTIVMSYWGEAGTDRWVFSAPMQTAIGAHNELFDALGDLPMLVMPAIESAGPTPDCPSYNFSHDFPGTPSSPAPALVTQVLDLVERYLQNPAKPQWASKWLQLFDRDGVARYAINLLHVASAQIPGDAGEVFAAGFSWVADAVFARTGIRVGFTLDALPKGQDIDQPVSDRGGWVPWFVPGPLSATPGAAVTAVWADEDHLDLFTVSGQGAVVSTYWDGTQTPGYRAGGWFAIHPETQFSGPGPVAAVWADEDHLDLFAVTQDGAVATIFWDQDGYRGDGWLLIHPETHFKAGTAVTALWADEDHLDLFAVDADGIVRTIWWDRNEPTGYRADGWLALHPETISAAGGQVTARWADEDHLDLFVVSSDHAVSTLWWDRAEPTGWRPEGWSAIGAERRFVPGAVVSALWVPREGVQHLDLFTVDMSGQVSSIWWDADPGGYRGEGWFTIPGSPVTLVPGTPVSAVWISDEELLLLVADTAGAVRGAHWTAGAGWLGWFSVRSAEMTAAPGVPLTTVVSPDPNHVDLFATDPNGTVHSTYYRFTVNDTFVATGGSAGTWLEQNPAVLAIQGFIPDIYSDDDGQDDRFQAKTDFWSDWRGTGLPVMWDVEPGYDATIFRVTPWGNDTSWRIWVQESWDPGFPGMVYNTWNGYTEGYAAMPTLEYGDRMANWMVALLSMVRTS